jgi:hypothetical protein
VKASKNSKTINIEEYYVKVILYIGGGVERYGRFDADDSIAAVRVSASAVRGGKINTVKVWLFSLFLSLFPLCTNH